MNIDAWEVCQAAATKPFRYMPYSTSLGVGGHCIPVNPYYLLSNCDLPLLEACTRRMRDRPGRMGDEIMARLHANVIAKPRVLIIGMGFKRGQSTLSNSPGRALSVHLLSNYEVYIEFADPSVRQDALTFIPPLDEDTCWTSEYLKRVVIIVVAVKQPGLSMQVVEEVEVQGVLVHWFCDV
jgi:UDP-N-acetyl-D-mannosaminuronate dehydrogenase